MLERIECSCGDGDAVDLLEKVRDAAALEHDAAASNLGGVGGEDGRDADPGEKRAGLRCVDAGELELAEGSAKTAALGNGGGIEGGGEPTALAVVGLREIDELEVEAEGACELVGGGQVVRVGVNAFESLVEVVASGWIGLAADGCVSLAAGWIVGLAAGNRRAAQGLDGIVERRARLLAEDFAEQHAERPDVSAEGSFLGPGGTGLEFGETVGPGGWSP